MIITLKLNPQVPSGEVLPLAIERQGETLLINGEALDLSFMSVGDSLPPGSIDHPLLASATIDCDESGFLLDGLLFHIDVMQRDPAACFPDPVVIKHDGHVFLPLQIAPPTLPLPEPEPEPGPDLLSMETPDSEQKHEHQD